MASVDASISAFPIAAKKPTGSFTGAQAIEAMLNAKRLQSTKPGATVQTLADAVTLAGLFMAPGELVTTTEYLSGTGVGSNVYLLVDAGSSGARPTHDGGRVIHVLSAGLYLQGLFLDGTVRLSQFGAPQAPTLCDDEFDAAVAFVASLQSGSNTRPPSLTIDEKTYQLAETHNVGNVSIVGAGKTFSNCIVWSGGQNTVIQQGHNSVIERIRFLVADTSDAANMPTYWVDKTQADGFDWADGFYDVYFDRAVSSAILLADPVNVNIEKVRFNNANRLVEVNGSGTGSYNRVINIDKFTIDFTQNAGVNLPVETFVKLNVKGSDQFNVTMRHGRIEGNYAQLTTDAGIFQVEDASGGSAGDLAVSIDVEHIGVQLSGTSKDVHLIKSNTANSSTIIPFSVKSSRLEQLASFITGTYNADMMIPDIPTGVISQLTCALPVSYYANKNVYQLPQRVSMGDHSNYFDNDGSFMSFSGSPFYTNQLLMGAPDSESTALVISGGEIDVSGKSGLITVDTESSAATDTLTTINGGQGNQIIMLRVPSNARDVIIADNTGNIRLEKTGGDFTLSTIVKMVTLIYSAQLSQWLEI